VTVPLLACGPWFPNRLLDGGDDAVLVAPYANFFREIERMHLVSSSLVAKPPTNGQSHAQQTSDADLEDLWAALRKAGVGTKERSAILKRYKTTRAKFHSGPLKEDDGARLTGKADRGEDAEPDADDADVPTGLPGEFEDYFRGALAWTDGNTNAAVTFWGKLLDRPAHERQFKSTWAAFMLGKALMTADADLATDYFRQVRRLSREGFADSLGLAASSLGWEAKVYYDQGKFLPATELYLEQAATGDKSAVVSLMWAAARIIEQGGPTLEQAAKHPKVQRIITAYLLQERISVADAVNVSDFTPEKKSIARWLSAVEAVGERDVAAAEQLALAAYRYGDVNRARRWLKVSKDTPVSQWLMAKLLLRDGKVDRAAALLARVSHSFPLAPAETAKGKSPLFQDSLYFERGDFGPRTARDQLWGELGALRLARREYTEALDALLRAGFWDDAAYVAERVLTLDELKAFVDRNWSDDPGLQKPRDDEELSEEERQFRERLAHMRESVRHLLARRLTRNNRGTEARPFLSPKYLPDYETLMTSLDAGYDESRPAEERAQHLMAAARVARHHGMELLATELDPDYAVYGGNFQNGVTAESRKRTRRVVDSSDAKKEVRQVLHASDDELRRTADEPADPPQRFHYRYVAAELGWVAAQLLPDDSLEKARILCESGTWIKRINPPAADRFYKQLVRKCRNTAIGRWADYIRWFPLLDGDGNLQTKQPGPPTIPQPAPEPQFEAPVHSDQPAKPRRD